MQAPHVVVLGAGIAGLVAGFELSRRGLKVTVLEAAPMPGGRTSTFRDARGRLVDTGLHVVADHYVNLVEVLAELGVSRHLHWVGKHAYLRPGRAPMDWYFSDRPPPFHLARPMREMPLGWRERAGLARMGLAMAAHGQADLEELDHVRYIDWHERLGLGEGFLLELAEAASDASTFLGVEQASARAVLSWMKYMMRHKRAGDVGLFRGTLAERLVDPLVQAIEKNGGVVRTSARVTGFDVEGRRIRGVRVQRSLAEGPCHAADGAIDSAGSETTIEADEVVSAMSLQGLRAAMGGELARDAGLSSAFTLTTASAVSLILWFDRLIEDVPEGAPLVTGCAMRDFVDMKVLGRAPEGAPGSVYQFVMTRAEARIRESDDEIAKTVADDLARVWPAARGARVVDAAVERIGAAMFAAVPGAHRKRPETATSIANFTVAGDWVRHDLNASMEGAALSGRRAANAVLARRGSERCPVRVAPDPGVVPVLRPLRRGLGLHA